MGLNIAILGLGAMGSRMAKRLLGAGYEVAVYNRTASRASALASHGATFAPTPRAAATDADLVLSVVRDDDASESVWLDPDQGAAAGLKPGAVAVESSTLTPAWARTLSQTLKARGVEFIDAPVVGTRPQADSGQLVHIVGGAPASVERARAPLSALSTALHHVGPVGAGMTLKLAINTLFGVQVAALAETMGVLARAGVDTGDAVELLNTMPTTSPALRGIGALLAGRKFDPLFPVELVEKDFSYMIQVAQSLGTETPTASAVHAVYERAKSSGFGGDNIVAVAKLFEQGDNS